MENVCIPRQQDQKFELPSGFRFHPTDEELINYYLIKKVLDRRFSAIAIADVDLNKCEPWDLPGKSLKAHHSYISYFHGDFLSELCLFFFLFFCLKGWPKWVKQNGIFSV